MIQRYRAQNPTKPKDRRTQIETTHRLLNFGLESKKNIAIAKQIKEEVLDDECTFEPYFYTNESTRINAKEKRNSQASLLGNQNL